MTQKGYKIGYSIIGENCFIRNSSIGSFTSVGDGATIEDSSIEYCIILGNIMISNVEKLEESLMGEFARIIRNPNKRYARRLGGCDYSIVEI